MIKKIILLTYLCAFSVPTVIAAETTNAPAEQLEQVYKLQYIEREPGVDDYELTMLVSDRYIRVDESGDGSGYIVYDDKKKMIYSVSHHDRSVLVIKEYVFKDTDLPVKYEIEYLALVDAPKVSGNNVFNYRVYTSVEDKEETCAEVQLVENLLPAVTKMLKNYQQIIAGQQVRMTDNTVSDMQTACYFIDQVYNAGLYYEKGLPVQEWHSNERSKILASYKKSEVSGNKFNIPKDYKQFSIGQDSKTFIK